MRNSLHVLVAAPALAVSLFTAGHVSAADEAPPPAAYAMSAPKWDESKFTVEKGKDLRLSISLRY